MHLVTFHHYLFITNYKYNAFRGNLSANARWSTYLFLKLSGLVVCFLCKCSCILIRYLSSKLLRVLAGVCRGMKNRGPMRAEERASVPQVTDWICVIWTRNHTHTQTHTPVAVDWLILISKYIMVCKSHAWLQLCKFYISYSFFFSPEAVAGTWCTSWVLCMWDVHMSPGVTAL